MRFKALLLATLLITPLNAQQTADPELKDLLGKVVQRLDALEQQNTELKKEIVELRKELNKGNQVEDASATRPAPQTSQETTGERVGVVERRTEELSQTKVEASQKFPVTLTGMLLFNAFDNSKGIKSEPSGYSDYLLGPDRDGATFRQTLLGFDFQGPSLPGGGRVNASLMTDFDSLGYANDYVLRIRRAMLSFAWKNRSISFGQDKPLISLRDPDSLAEVGVPALAGAGNLWGWMPQVRYEERFQLNAQSGITGQLAAIETNESYVDLPEEYSSTLERGRPGIEGRLAYWHRWGDTRRMEIASGFHASTTHVYRESAASRAGSLDWLFIPSRAVKVTGSYVAGQNFGGIGGLPLGVTVLPYEGLLPVHSEAGWAEVSYAMTNRLTLNVFGGGQFNRLKELYSGDVPQNVAYGANLMYHWGPNVITAFEAQQMRALLLGGGTRLVNHYDLALAYLF